ncbi:MAG: UGSC family (seleno)protein [Methanothermobacter sp.]
MKVLNPLAETEKQETRINRIGKIEKISLINNTKPNADLILEEIPKKLENDNIQVSRFTKPAGAPATDHEIQKASQASLCILALGDCGSCTTWLILDAIRLEKLGTPTITICSDEFSKFAKELATAHGASKLRIAEIEHPIAGLKKEKVIKKTKKTIGYIKKFIG